VMCRSTAHLNVGRAEIVDLCAKRGYSAASVPTAACHRNASAREAALARFHRKNTSVESLVGPPHSERACQACRSSLTASRYSARSSLSRDSGLMRSTFPNCHPAWHSVPPENACAEGFFACRNGLTADWQTTRASYASCRAGLET
jgi:hypothetical protein